jgi:hypothetical protein
MGGRHLMECVTRVAIKDGRSVRRSRGVGADEGKPDGSYVDPLTWWRSLSVW